MRCTKAIIALFAIAGCPALAQPGVPQLTGSWSGETSDPGGVAEIATRYDADGTFRSVVRTSNGLLMRFAGHYTAEPAGGGQVRVDKHIDSYSPHTICAQSPGFAPQCRPNPINPDAGGLISFTSPSSFVTANGRMARDPAPRLLAMDVPDRFVSQIAPPPMPQLHPYQKPTLHPYVTPGGAGSVAGLRADSQAQEYRVCGVNNGTIVHNLQDGSVKCVN